jgi:ABC-type cobalt transport system substrate-binding protein
LIKEEIKKSAKSYIMDDFEDDEGSESDEGSENDVDSAENISSIPTSNEVKICSVFGPPSGPIKTEALFSLPSASSSIFHGLDLSASKQLPSFATISTVDKPIFGTKTEGFSFAGAGQSIFSASRNSGYGNSIDEADESHVEDNDHDPHFEPIVPLPDLVEVTTGEEEEEETFRQSNTFVFEREPLEGGVLGIGGVKVRCIF